MLNIAVLVSGGGTNLQALIDAKVRGDIPHGNLSLVVASHGEAYALERATGAGIATAVLNPTDYADSDAYARALIERLDRQGIDLVVLAGFLVILSPVFTEHYRERIINVHPSLIPSFCGPGYYGLKVHKAALKKGVKLTGATVHFVTAEVDGGPIIAQIAVPVEPGDTPETLQRRVMEQGEWIILPRAVAEICRLRSQKE